MLYIVYTTNGKKEVFTDKESAYIYYLTNNGLTMVEKHATDYYNEISA